MKNHQIAISTFVVVISSALSACEVADSDKCDPGQIVFGNACMNPPPPPAPDAGASDAGAESSPSAASKAGGGFGETCTESSQCAAPSDYCAKQPGDTKGFCTATGCVATPGVCPAGYSCMDLRSVGAVDLCNKP